MSKIENLRDLFVEQGRELHSTYEQELKELPKFEKQVGSAGLRKIINKQVQIAKNQQDRLAETFFKLRIDPEGNKSLTAETILSETHKRINQSKNGKVCDAGIVGSLQQLGHKKIADLGALSAYADEIGQVSAALMLHQSFEEEKALGRELISLAKSDINKKAYSSATTL